MGRKGKAAASPAPRELTTFSVMGVLLLSTLSDLIKQVVPFPPTERTDMVLALAAAPNLSSEMGRVNANHFHLVKPCPINTQKINPPETQNSSC